MKMRKNAKHIDSWCTTMLYAYYAHVNYPDHGILYLYGQLQATVCILYAQNKISCVKAIFTSTTSVKYGFKTVNSIPHICIEIIN